MPIGAAIAAVESNSRRWLETEVRLGFVAFGGRALLSAVALVVAPQTKLENHWVPPLGAVAGFLSGVPGHISVG